jgi:hypothetical protein
MIVRGPRTTPAKEAAMRASATCTDIGLVDANSGKLLLNGQSCS